MTPGADGNIVLVGMPGAGKSTVGVLLAKRTSRGFIDTDVYIQEKEGRRLQDILDAEGKEAFCRMEERHVLSLDLRRQVIATGGSVVYRPAAMAHLKAGGAVAHLDLPCEIVQRRLRDMDSRGIVMEKGQSVCQLYAERRPLYVQYADVTVDAAGLGHEDVVARILSALGL